MENSNNLYVLLDLLISEYGWSLEYCLKLPGDVVMELVKTIRKRQHEYWKTFTKLSGVATSCGFSGKLGEIDKLFDNTKSEENTSEIDKSAWKGQVKSMWIKVKSKNKKISVEEMKELGNEFEDRWAKDEKIEF